MCRRWLPLSAYNKHPKTRDRRQGRCRECQNQYCREWYSVHRDKQIAYVKQYYRDNRESRLRQCLEYSRSPHGKTTRCDAARRYAARNPDKKRAHHIVAAARKSGLLVPPERCADCGELSDKIRAHHEDYTQPLDVLWLCRECHRRRHARL